MIELGLQSDVLALIQAKEMYEHYHKKLDFEVRERILNHVMENFREDEARLIRNSSIQWEIGSHGVDVRWCLHNVDSGWFTMSIEELLSDD